MKAKTTKAGGRLVLVCANCKRIKDSRGHWRTIPGYINKFAGSRFSHCMCEACAEKLYSAEPWYEL
ncbi:MAG: hypothetical protein Q8O90_06540, partial [Elusimicrobiota bacterium]|nr:hypothetical protein [Elusimicrobiota bacterium]